MRIPPIPPRPEIPVGPNPDFAQKLSAGLDLLWDGTPGVYDKERFICHTLRGLGCWKLQQLIEDRLGRTRLSRIPKTYGGWIEELDSEYTDQEIQAGRKAWMLDMIQEFSSPPEFTIVGCTISDS